MKRNVATLVFRDETATHTYQTWWTVSVDGGEVYMLSNAGGNGQCWKRIGSYATISGALCFSLERGSASMLLGRALSDLGYSVYVPGGFPERLPQGYFSFPPQHNPRTGRELTAWDSVNAVFKGERPRNKNRNREREKVARISLAARMRERGAK
jgi:hypothetical protein